MAGNYVGFNKLKGQLASEPGVTNPGGLAASIGRKKYGGAAMAKASASGKPLGKLKKKKRKVHKTTGNGMAMGKEMTASKGKMLGPFTGPNRPSMMSDRVRY